MQIRQLDSDVCIDSSGKPEDLHQPVGLWPCHRQGGNQVHALMHAPVDQTDLKKKISSSGKK